MILICKPKQILEILAQNKCLNKLNEFGLKEKTLTKF